MYGRQWSVGVGLLLVLSAASVWAGVRKISEKEVPQAVMHAVRDEVPGASFMSGIINEDRGTVSYRLNVKARDGSVVYLRVTPAGDITYFLNGFQVEDIVPADRMPRRISDRLREVRPNARVLEVEMGRHHDRSVYEITIANGDSVEEIYITESGEVLKREEKRYEHDHHHGNHSHFSITF